jgi:hypothetical protein
MSEDDKCGGNITHQEMLKIRSEVDKAAVNAFKDSKTAFEVMVRFTLTTDKESTVDMIYKDAGITEYENLGIFRDQLQTITNFHSKKGTVYVVLHYGIGENKKDQSKSPNTYKAPLSQEASGSNQKSK